MLTLVIFLVILLLVISFYCIKFALILVRVRDAIESSLDVIDESYFKISEILNIPIFSDSKEVKNTIKEIVRTKEVLLFIASELSNSFEEEKTEE